MSVRFLSNITITRLLIWTMISTLIWYKNVQGQGNDPGWFGSMKQYKCRCMDDTCNSDGICPNDLCSDGWFGPGCQYIDLVATSNASNLMHSRRNSGCKKNINLQKLTVNVRSEFPFTWLRLQVRDPLLLQDFKLTFTDSRQITKSDCKNMRNATVNDRTLDIHCDLNVAVQYVTLSGEGVKSLCTLYISGGRNVALRQNAKQSSTYPFYVISETAANNAVNGNTNNAIDKESCTLTNTTDINPNWNVTLSHTHMIHMYVLYNRDSFQVRLKGLTLRSFTQDLVEVFNYTDKENRPLTKYTILSVEKTQPISLVNINISRAYLTLCEVELYGDSVCKPFTYGRECQYTCNCAVQNETCFVSTGGCPSGCSAGFHGESCNQTCDNGKYGEGCRFNCSQFCFKNKNSESQCEHIDGACIYGCQNGYQAPKCDHLIIDDSSISDAAIIGTVTLVVILIIVVVSAVIIWWRCRAKTKKTVYDAVMIDGTDGSNLHDQTTLTELESRQVGQSSKYEENRAGKPMIMHKQTTKNLITTTGNLSDGNVYNNETSRKSSTSINVEDLASFMVAHEKSYFKEQFNTIQSNTNASTSVGMSVENKHKNRYKNICAYDHSRVRLKICKERNQGDYINASYINGYNGQEIFIASQGPTTAMLDDFIRMILEQKVEVVVMLTNLTEDGKIKCERYWPEDDEMKTGDIQVKLTTTEVFADYTIRRLQLSQDGQQVHTLTQFQFTSWPDKDVPTTTWSLVDFEQRVTSISSNKPIVVHCSAGVGRTGTFIALRNVVGEALNTGSMNFLSTVEKLRFERVQMVQTADQYEFLHRAAQVAILCMGTTIVSNNITNRIKELERTDQSKLKQEFKAICVINDNSTDHNIEKNITNSSSYEISQTVNNKLKNRFQNVLAKEDYRVILMGDSQEGLEDYINAVFIPSFCMKNQQILTQIPLLTTVNDFWRMVTQYKVTLVVAFELDLNRADSSIGNYFPMTESEELSSGYFKIKSQKTMSHVLWNQQQLVVSTDTQSSTMSITPGKEYQLTHLTCTRAPKDLKPSDLLSLMTMIRSSSPIGSGKTVYMCRNGAAYSGLICILSLLLARLDNDHRLTVPLVVGAIKAIRPQVIPTVHQYKLLYQVLAMYHEATNVYSNFGD